MNRVMRWVGGTLRTFVRRGVRLAVTIVLGVVVVGLWPSSLGGSLTYVIVSGDSMLPTMRHGDLVLARHRSAYELGDVIVYEIGDEDVGAGVKVIHRIIGGSAEEGFITQGDNREARDVWTPGPDLIAGGVWVHVPLVGRALLILRSPLIFAALAAWLAVIAVLLDEDDASAPLLGNRRQPARRPAASGLGGATSLVPGAWCSATSPPSGAWPRDGPSVHSWSMPDLAEGSAEGGP